MGLFSDLYSVAEEFPISVTIIPVTGQLSVTVLPHPRAALKKAGIVPMQMVGSPAELDEEFIELLRDYRRKHLPLSHQVASVGAEIERAKESLKSRPQRANAERHAHQHGQGKPREPKQLPAVHGHAAPPEPASPVSDVTTSQLSVQEVAAPSPATGSERDPGAWARKHLAPDCQQDMFGGVENES